MTNYFIAVTGKDDPRATWERCKELAQWGITKRNSVAESVAEGDKLLVWLGGLGFGATAEFAGPVVEVTPNAENEWGHRGRTYPFRFPIRETRDFATPYKPTFEGGRDPETGLATAQLQGGLLRTTEAVVAQVRAHLESIAPGPQQVGAPVRKARSEALVLVGYFLSRCGQFHEEQTSDPPAVLDVKGWTQAFELFYARLNDGRSREQFISTLGHTRDSFDPRFPASNRRGWWQRELNTNEQQVFDKWKDRSDEELWEQVKQYVAQPGSGDFGSTWDSLVAHLNQHPTWRSLARDQQYHLAEIEGDVIRYVRVGTGREDTMTRTELAGLWNRLRESPAGFRPSTSSRSAILALLPNVEFGLEPLRLYWVEPASHELGTIQERQAPRDEEKHQTLRELAAELFLLPEYLAEVDWLMRDKKQLVFYGPPGTGKTFVAVRYAEWLAGSASRVELIQFHPSYAYEDFIEGIRPVLDEVAGSQAQDKPKQSSELRYRLDHGLLMRLAQRASDDPNPDHRYVLVIDEINRANLARVFGELLFLLEYREQSVKLQYSRESFSLPENLYVLGTMNTADRSIALVDFALRRRFHFVHFPADAAVLRRWLEKENPAMVEVAALLDHVNTRLDNPDFAIGFSYFMHRALDDVVLERIWKRSVVPALAEYFYRDPKAVQEFSLVRVRQAVAKGALPGADVDEGGDIDAAGSLAVEADEPVDLEGDDGA